MAGLCPSHASDPDEQQDPAAGQQQREHDAHEAEGGLASTGAGELTGVRRPVTYAGYGACGGNGGYGGTG